MLGSFVRDVVESINPKNYSKLYLFPVSRGISFFSKLLLFSYVIFCLLSIPMLLDAPEKIGEELSHINISTNGNFSADKVIIIPEGTGLIVIDVDATKNVKGAKFTLSKDSLFYKPFWSKTQSITYKELSKPKENLEKIVSFATFLASLLAPIILITAYFFFWMKYFLIALILGTVLYLLLDLTSYSMSYQKVLTTALFCLIWIVPIEVISTALDTGYLIKFASISGVPLYSATTILYLTLFCVSLAFAVFENKKKVTI